MLDKKFKIYLYFCVFIFFFLLGIVLFYSFGYKYSIEEKKAVQTGAIIIKTHPEKVDIYKNDFLYKNNRTIANLFSDFVKIDNLKIGKYNIKVKKEGYFNWEKNINVKGGAVTELKNIVLLKKNYNKNIILSKIGISPDENNVWVNNKKDKIAYKKERGKMLSLVIFNFDKNEEKIIADFNKAPFSQIQKGYNLDDVIFSEDDTKIILKIATTNKTIWYLLDMDNKNRIYDLTAILKDNKEIKNRWNFFFGKSLFYIKDNTLYKFDYSKMSSKKILENVNIFLIQDDHIYFFNLNDNKLYSGNINNLSDVRSIAAMPEDFDSKLLAEITRTGKNTYLILSSSGKLYFINDRNKVSLINSSVKKANFSNNDKRIAYSNDHEIWIYYIKEKISQPTKKEQTNELITRFSGNISNIFLHKDEEHLFYKEGGVFKFLELDGRDKRNVFEIMKIDNDNIFYS
jgi:hypothetical protein